MYDHLGGSGLGLWISRHIVHMLHKVGWNIFLDHRNEHLTVLYAMLCCAVLCCATHAGFSSAGRDQGSTFYFELPLHLLDWTPSKLPEQCYRLAATSMVPRRSAILTGEDGGGEGMATKQVLLLKQQ